MNELLSSGLWPRIRKLGKEAKIKSAAVAYVTDDRYLKFGKGDVLVTDASDEAIKAGQTSAQLLQGAFKRKATIVSIPGLHAKVYVFDNVAVIGSANLSKESERRTEAALVTDQPTTVSSARSLIETWKSNGDPVDEAFISRISKLPVEKVWSHGGRKQIRSADPNPRTWLIGLKQIQEKKEEQATVAEGTAAAKKHISDEESSVSWIRFRGNSKFRREAKKGDVVICIWSPTAKGKPQAVYHHAPILLRKNDEENNLTWIYVEKYPDAEDNTLTWKQFQNLHAQVGLPGKLSQWANREIARHYSDALHELWFA